MPRSAERRIRAARSSKAHSDTHKQVLMAVQQQQMLQHQQVNKLQELRAKNQQLQLQVEEASALQRGNQQLEQQVRKEVGGSSLGGQWIDGSVELPVVPHRGSAMSFQ